MSTWNNKVWTPEEIKAVLEKNNDQVGKALVQLYDKQTEDEKLEQSTKHSNGVGFAGPDAEILSKFAQAYKKYGKLSEKQLALARKRIMKYAKQLAKIANNLSVAAEQARLDDEFKQVIPEEYRDKVAVPTSVEYMGNGVICTTYEL